MRNGNLLRDSIREVIKLREDSKDVDGKNINNKELTLDELAAKEILEDLKKDENKVDEKATELAINVNNQISVINQEQSSLEDYESMPITDFGLAMLRGMGWDPKKGIGLNGQIVSPLAPTLRPKGMGLGADKTPAAKNIASNGEVLVMKKGAAVKIISGPYNNLYGRIEGFDELPGRLMVRITTNNIVVSLNEIMVQLVSNSEFNKNIENNQLKIEADSENKVKTEKKRLNNVETFELIPSDNSQKSKPKEKYNSVENHDETEKNISNSEEIRDKNHHRRSREKQMRRSRSPKYQKKYSDRKTSNIDRKYNRHKDYKESRKPRRRHSSSSSSSSSSSIDVKADKKFSRRSRRENNSSDSDADRRKQSYKSKHYSGHSSKSRSHTKEDYYSSKYKNYYKR
ncbi:hypothetical protein O3M35_000730 [Rhynocoris fuscipes]|uniref:G-patch domain-containing protein n=1 Tax=Rhynocoris fuscipes TaxID=488301 RepID=A0AAW1DPH9_9HEMI